MCEQQRFKAVCASTQSDQNIRRLPEVTLVPRLPIERPSKTMIRLRGCAGGSESLMCAHVNLCHLLDTGSL